MVKTIGLLTSGGDAPGMNACIRSIVRGALNLGIKVIGIRRGYQGLIENDVFEMDKNSVSNIIMKGGTILFSARSKEYETKEGLEKAFDNYKKNKLDCLIALGGDGTFRGAFDLAKKGANVIGVPASIDLDINCTEYTIGFDTAINTAMDCIDKIRDTSNSHKRCSIIEVMGRNAGYIAAYAAIATGAEEMLIPENRDFAEPESIAVRLKMAMKKGKTHYIIVNAEGIGHSQEIADKLESLTGIACRVAVLGYLQRGGSPTCKDRVYATIMGMKAVEAFVDGKKNRLIVYENGEFKDLDMSEGLVMLKSVSEDMRTILPKIENK